MSLFYDNFFAVSLHSTSLDCLTVVIFCSWILGLATWVARLAEAWLDDPKPAKPQEFGLSHNVRPFDLHDSQMFVRFTRCLKLKLTTSFRQEVLPWPRNAFEQSFERMERLLLAV